jgi:hypothetical protein
MSAISLQGNAGGTGTLTIAAPSTNTNRTLTLPDQTGIFTVSGPAFSAYAAASQTLTSANLTKIQFNTKEFDTASAFDNATNYRFQPLVAGYYQVNWNFGATATTSMSQILSRLYKNGSAVKNSIYIEAALTGASEQNVVGSQLISLNGSSDYLEIFGFVVGVGTITTVATSLSTNFQAAFVRAA